MQISTAKPATKICPFCAETILSAAIKCRYCGEFLNTERAKSLMAGNSDPAEPAAKTGEVLYTGQPTMWVLAGAFAKGGLLLIISIILLVMSKKAGQAAVYLSWSGLILGFIVAMALIDRIFVIKLTSYKVSSDRIEYARGVFGQKIDNLDMFRVVDIKLERTFLDLIAGVGSVILTTTDKSHPKFKFEKIRNCQGLYEIIKKASISADRNTNVIHME